MSAEPAFHIVPKEPEPDRIAVLEARVAALEATHKESLKVAERVQALEVWMGMAPVHPAPASPEVAPKRQRKAESALPQSDGAKAVAGIFHRKLTTPWSPKEIAAFKALGKLDPADLLTLANYYENERKKGHREDGSSIGVHRHDLGTFLNNYRGEVDRANVWATRHPAAARKPIEGTAHVKAAAVEPPGWQGWFDAAYTSKAGTRWKDCPEEIRIKFKP